MSDVGRLSDGQKEIQRLQDAGFSGPEIQQYQADQTATLRAGGFGDDEVQAYWGQPSPDPTPAMRRAADYGAPRAPQLIDRGTDEERVTSRPATTTWEAMQAGWQNSVIGMLARGKEADLSIDAEQTPLVGQVMGSLMQAGVDLPSIALGGRVAPGSGTSPAGVTGRVAKGSSQGAVAMGLPDFERRLLIDHYRNGDYQSVEDFGARWWKALQGAGEAAAGGAAFGPAGELGRVAEAALTRAGVPTVMGAVARATTVASTGAAAAEGIDATLSNRDFSVHGFVVNAVSILGLELGGHYVGTGRNRRYEPGEHAKHVAENMMDIYARTGVSPADQVRMAAEDPAVRAEILGRNVDGDTVTPSFNASAPAPELRGEQPEASAFPVSEKSSPTLPPKPETPKPQEYGIGAGGDAEIPASSAPAFGYEAPQRTYPANNYSGNLGRYTRRVYHQTNVKGSFRLIPHSDVVGELGDLFLSDHPDLALSQRQGAGVMLEFDAGGIRGRINSSKPAMRASFESGQSEYVTNLATQSELQSRLRAVRINDNLPVTAVEKARLQRTLRRMEADGWQKTLGEGYTEWTRPEAPTEETPATEAPPKPNINAHTIRDEHERDMQANDTQAYNIAAVAERARRGTMGGTNTTVDFFVDQERSAAYAARHGISEDDVVSPVGAVGRYQVMPDTARRFGFDPARLHDPAVNRAAAEAFHADLVRRFPRDPEAQIVAYIAGPDKAYHWIQSGRNDRTLGPNTRAYLAHGRTRLGIEGDQLPEVDQANYAASDSRQSGDGDWMPPGPSYEDLTRPEEPVDIGGGGGERPPGEPPEPPEGGGQRRLPGPRPEVFKLNEDSLASLIRDQYAPEAKEPFYRRLNPMRIISDFKSELSHVETTQTASDQLNVRDMLRQRYASAERTGMFVDSGPIDAITLDPMPGPSYKDAFRAVKADGGTLEGFRDYRNAARTGELAERDIESGIDPQVAARFVHLTKGKYERGAQTLARVKDGVVDYVRDSGRYSAEGADAMKNLNRYHISMRRAVDPNYVPPGSRPRGRFGNTKKIKGSDRLFIDQDVADFDNMSHQIAMADHNRAVVSFVEGWKRGEVPEVDLTLDPKATADMQKLLPDPRKPRGKVDVLDANGKPIPDPEAAYHFQQETELQRAEHSLAPNKFVIYKDGRPEVWEFRGDPNVFRLLTYPGFKGKDSPPMKLAAGVAKFMRSGVATTTSFIERVFIRNELEDFVTGKDTGAPFQDFVGGIFSVLKMDKFYHDARAKGAIGTSLADIDRRYLKTQAADVFTKRGVWQRVWNTVNPYNWPEAARRIQRAHDSARRVGMMKRLVKGGTPPVKAAMATREGYMDLVEPLTGDWVNSWSRMSVFMRTSVKSIERMHESAVQRPGTFLLRGIGTITAITVLNYFWNKHEDQFLPEEERYANVPQWERDLFWVLPPIKIGDTYVRIPIPRPYTVGFVFATVPERILDATFGEDPRADREFMKTFMQQWMFPFTPALATPWLEDVSNTSFTGAPLVPKSLAEASGYMQYKPDTSETAKGLSRLLSPEVGLLSHLNVGLQVSPIVLDNYLKGWTGSLPYQVLKVLETPWHYDGRPWEAANLPLVGVFIMRNPGAGAQPIQDFYSEYDRVTAAHRDLKLAIDHQDLSEIHDAATLKAYLTISGVATALRNQSATLHAIERNQTLTNDEKQKYTDGLYSAMLATAKGGLAAIDALDHQNDQ